MSYHCPQCKHEMSCPCASCQSRWLTEKPWIDVSEGVIQCAGCGLTKSEDWWADQEFEQMQREEAE